MMFSPSHIILGIATTALALIAGLFYAWSCSVVPGLQRLPDAGYIAAMQSMNKAILNPVFFASFMGTVFLLPAATFAQLGQPVSARFWLLLAASVIYLAGVFGVTMVGNVPLNNALEAFPLSTATTEQVRDMRLMFEKPWNNLNLVRSMAGVLALVLTIMACMVPRVKPA